MCNDNLGDTPVSDATPRSERSGTSTSDYPRIAAEKYRAALERVANVHSRFQKELDSIDEEIGTQRSLSGTAIERFSQVGPCLGSIADNIKTMSEETHEVGVLVRSGREGLGASIADVRAAIEQLRLRNQTMQDILDIGQQVTKSVNEIAEIAIENKLIAINASVTASKAGDKAAGFKVIASEITKLSTAMSDRVGLIVDRSALVGRRMQQVMANMDESIQSTEKALSNIDEAFALLEHIDSTIQETDGANANMLAENEKLAQKFQTLNEALVVIERNAIDAGRQADQVQKTMVEQATFIRRIEQLLPGLQSISDAMAESAADDEGPKRLRSCESALSSYDPALNRFLRGNHYLSFVCIRLLRYSSDKKIVPYLAETWFLHPDGRTWEFKLKDNVLFSDGSPAGSRDVKFSLERLMNPALGSPYANLFSIIEGADEFIAGKAASISGIVIIDSTTMRFKLKNSFNFFLSLLALSFSSILKEDKAIFSRPLAKSELVSAGPFRFEESRDPTVDLLVRNEHFVNGRAFLDSFEIKRDMGDIPGALCRGELDLAYNMPAASADIFRRIGFGGELRLYTSRYCYGLVVNYTRDTFITRNAELRRALAMAIDKDAIVREVLGGKAVRADTILPPELLDIGDRRFIAYDPQEAKKIVEKYRTREDLSVPINLAFRNYSSIPLLEQIAEQITRSFTELGLKVNTSFRPAATPIEDFRDDYDLVFLGFLSELDLYSALEPFINPEGGDNYFHYDNPEVFGLLNDSITIKDNGARKEVFVNILEKLTLDVFMMPLFFNKSLMAIPTHVHSVFVSAEESFFPDAVFLSSEKAPRRAPQLTKQYAETIQKLGAETAIVVDTSNKLIATGGSIGKLIGLQKGSIREANDLFSSFAESAEKVQATRVSVVERIHGTTGEASKSDQATGLIQAGLNELMTALHGSVMALDQVKRDIHDMLAIVLAINKSNEFLGSIAINAAIISAKADSREGELVKVSRAIAEQAKRNTANADVIKGFLEEMSKAVDGHFEFLDSIVQAIGIAASDVGQSGKGLEEVGPLVDNANTKSSIIEEASKRLATLIQEARYSVDQINDGVDKLAINAETLQFGLDMEQAVAGILSDVAAVNKGIDEFMRG
jgi:ABC-type transport system substrate-binding protein/methyl-accepting chemotaxis protein